MSESDIVKAILDAYAGHPRIKLWRNNTGVARRHVRFGLTGQADITGIRDYDQDVFIGQRVEIECKQPGEKQSAEQIEFQSMIERFGGVYILARNIDDVVKVLG